MAKFAYQARSSSGAVITGSVDAVTASAAANQLIQNGVVPLHIDVMEQKHDIWRSLRERLGFYKAGVDELTLFCRQCYTLNKAGVPIIRGFRLLAESNRNPIFSEMINEVVSDLESGRELSSAISRHPKIFSSLFVNMIKVGETAGRLDQAFFYLYSYYENDKKTVNQIKAALRYPAFVLTALFIAVVIVMTFVIPKFAQFYQKNNLDLPLPTKIIMSISNFLVDYWYLLFGIAALAAVSFMRFVETTSGRLWFDRLKVRFWLVGGIVLRATLARFSRTLAMALNAGVPILQAINLTAGAVGNEYISTKILGMRESIARGESLLRAAMKQDVFTPIVMQMIAVGEETGRLDEMLEEVADFYDREVDYDVSNLNAIIEPLLTVAMAALVLLLMLGIFLPMWNLVDMVQ